MRLIKIKKLTIFKIVVVIAFIFTITKITTSFGMQHYYNVDFSTGLVTASTLNVRSGPGTNYPVVARVNKNSYIRVFAGVGNWYIVQIEGDYVGQGAFGTVYKTRKKDTKEIRAIKLIDIKNL